MRAGILTGLALACALAAAPATAQGPFPHLQHARLFPLCENCHAGIPVGNESTYYPAPAQCANCHDGVRQAPVLWTGPQRPPSNLTYSHVEHANNAAAAGDSIACTSCHTAPGAPRMAVQRADPARCLECHAHEAESHFATGRDCSVCHQPLVATQLSRERIAEFAMPASHGPEDFLFDHAPRSPVAATSCATCHARETCTRCHVDSTPPAIAALAPDPRVAALVREKPPEYPTPPSHGRFAWRLEHGAASRADGATCQNCHTQSSCTQCHRDQLPPAARALPRLPAGDPRGVAVPQRAAPVHQAGFSTAHAVDAAAIESSCQACHASSFCESCHQAPTSPVFHVPNFLARHAPESYANDTDCASCHNPEVFCRSCHAGLGMASQGRLGVAFHTANPFWIVGHGVAARQSLEGCVSCHSQSSCMQCHSAALGWRISPHGPGFDPARTEQANPLLCRLCHRAGGEDR